MIVPPVFVVEREVRSQSFLHLRHGAVSLQIDVLLLDTFPEPFDEDFVHPPTLAVHADGNVAHTETLRERFCGKLAALVRVEDLGAAVPGDRFFQGIHAERAVQCVGQPSG
jgi:hypothetical protein